jgi:hypothetical protein
LLLLLAPLSAHAQTGSAKSPAALTTEVNTLWPNNTTGQITPTNARQTLLDIIESYVGLLVGPFSPTGDVYFGSGRPFCDPVAHGAVPDGSTNSLAAFNACLTAFGAGGGTIWLDYIPGTGGTYCLTAASQAGIFNINVPVRLVFASAAVALSSCGSGFSTLEISAAVVVDGAYSEILGPGMDGASAFGANYPTLIMASGSGGSKLNNIVIYGGSPTIQWNCGECQASNVEAGFAYAVSGTTPAIWLFQNGGGELWNVASDQNEYPYGLPSVPFTLTAWATSQSVATNAVRSATCQDGNSYVIQALSGGTTASSGTGPICAGYSSTFTDGTVTWKLGYPAAEIKWDFDTGATDIHIHRADTGGAYVGLGFTNSLSGSGPSAITCIDCNGGNSYHAAVDAKAGGSQINFVSPNFAQCDQTSCALLTFESTFTGGVTFTGGEATGSPTGLSIAGGSSYQFAGVNLSSNTTGIAISGSSSKIAIVGGNVSGSTTGINISGTASEIVFTSNVGCVSGSTTCATNTSSGANIITSPNDAASARSFKSLSAGNISLITSTSYEQAGFKGTITPATSGNIMVTFTGDWYAGALNDICYGQVSYGTGTAPNNGASATGTVVGNPVRAALPSSGGYSPFALSVYITGLTPSTAYWLDLQIKDVSTSCQVGALQAVAIEE